MARWDPDSRDRLARAALALYAERGFENTTVAEIAERAGLTERTFFRHFADKREVLFGGSEEMQELLVRPVADAPNAAAPIDAVAAGLDAVAAVLQQRRDFARERQKAIAASAELRERELIKLASWSSALAGALRERGDGDPEASLTAEVAMAAFRVAFERWTADTGESDLARLIHESLDQVKVVSAGRA